jgi:hypothetical protein
MDSCKQVVGEMAADLASKMPALLTDSDAASITFQVRQADYLAMNG